MPPRLRPLVRTIEKWFDRHQRPLPWRQTYEPYFVWVSEVMAQQTRIDVVLRYFEQFMAAFPDLRTLASASSDEVTARWSGLGYYRRARMLREGAADVETRFGGVIPSTVDELRSIAGIGRYTAGAIASIAFDRHAPIVDGNVARILARLDGIEQPSGSAALMRATWKRAEELVDACDSPRKFNQGLMELGALICRPANPSCEACPLTKHCTAFQQRRTAELPLPKAKAESHEMRLPLYLVTDSEGRILMRREPGKLMTDLFHLPHGDSALLGGVPLRVERHESLGTFRHTVTSRRIQFELFIATLADTIADDASYAWIDAERIDRVPHPSYVTKALRLAQRHGSTPAASNSASSE